MPDVSVRPMTAEQFGAFRERAVAGYAAAQVAAGNWRPEEAGERSERSFRELLPEGVDTPGMLLLSATAPGEGVVGCVWVALESPSGRGAWIYDIEVDERYRGRGCGRALLEAAEAEVRRHGVASLGLNVFAENHVARSLYESAGYAPTSMYMRKTLD